MENVEQKYCPFCKDSTLDIMLDENTGELHLYALQEILKGFIHSIFCPIVVSVITTLITLLLVG